MANIALRNPQYKFIEVPSSGVQSVECTIIINGVLRYTLVKNVSPSTGCNFDISELVRDYLDITYSATYTVDIVLTSINLKKYSGLNATGSQVGSTVNYTDLGFEAYGYFNEGSNPEVPFTVREMDYMSQAANQEDQRGEIVVAYTVWSRKRGAGREIITKLRDWTIANKFSRLVTLSPLTPMATHFHIKNGAKQVHINDETQNFEYKL